MKMIRLIFLGAMALGFFSIFVSVPQAGAWHVKVYNTTDFESTVKCYDQRLCVNFFLCNGSIEATIPPHSSYTFKTGAWCPVTLTGAILERKNTVNVGPGYEEKKNISLTCLGPQREDVENIEHCAANCFNSEWTIVQHDDGSWHFHKGNHTSDMRNDTQVQVDINADELEE
ncbi:MAG: hypothetical protein CSYNP_04297 [Syntrophus sp. SKADARSKE-3]|nr:hypothetical protein [Syntrophus sp. SKADARSKE-3]